MIDVPSPISEDWKYTSFHAFAADKFDFAVKKESAFDAPKNAHYIVFMNGYYLTHDITDNSLSLAFSTQILNKDDDPFVQLNEKHLQEKQIITISGCSQLPLHFIFINDADKEKEAHFYRQKIILAVGSNVTIIAHHLARNHLLTFINHVMHIEIKENSHLCYIKYQQENNASIHVSHLTVTQSAHSHVACHHVHLGAVLSRETILVELMGAYTDTILNGFYFVSKKQHHDTHTRINHCHPHGTSQEYYKGIAAESSHTVYNGKIVVYPGADKTHSVQHNKNLLLSSYAEMDTKPELEIYAEDVRCAHGATVGALDEDALFYLQSRGIAREEAMQLLISAFSEDILTAMPTVSLKADIRAAILKKLSEAA